MMAAFSQPKNAVALGLL